MSRLIDADALIALIKKRLKNTAIIGWLCRIIAEVPTVDAVPVVHGRWETYTDVDEEWGDLDFSKCSICGNLHYNEYRYCPTCGAKMDLEVGGDG